MGTFGQRILASKLAIKWVLPRDAEVRAGREILFGTTESDAKDTQDKPDRPPETRRGIKSCRRCTGLCSGLPRCHDPAFSTQARAHLRELA